MKYSKILSYSALAVFTLGLLVGCEDESANDNLTRKDFVSFVDMPLAVDVPQGETATVQAKIVAGHTSNEDRVINLQLITESLSGQVVTTADADEFSFPATVTIPAGSKEATFPVTFNDIDLGYSGKLVVIGIVPAPGIDMAMHTAIIPNENGGGVEFVNDRLVVTGRRQCLDNPFTIEIVTDLYGDETTWELYDGDFNLVADGGPYARLVGGGERRFLCLEDGNYTFVIIDSEGDGMNDGTNEGYYRLIKYDADGNEIEVATGGQFGEDEVTEFSIP
jgi:hypothetical protein